MSEASTRPLGIAGEAVAINPSASGILQTIKNWLPYFVGFFSLFFVWHAVSTYVVASVLFPPPYAVLLRFIELLQDGVLL